MKAILSTLAVTGVSATAVHSKTMVTPQPPATPTLESLLEISKDKNNNLGQAKVDEKSVKDEMRKLGFFQTEFDDKVKSLGLDRKKHLDGMSAQKAEHQWHQQLREIQKKADHKRRTMKNDEALKTLEGKLSRKEREELSFLMTKKDEFVATGKLSADDKEMFVRAMVALNDMYLAIDDERINTLTTCTVTLFDMYRKVFFHWQTIRELEGMIGQSYSDLMKAAQQWWSSNMDKYAQESTLAQVKAVQNGRMQELNIDLEKKESDAALFRFIIGHVGSQCASGGLQKKEGGLLLAETASKMSNEERAQCSKFCAARADDPITKNAVLLKIFSDPAVEQQAMDNLDRHAVHSYQETLRNLREAEREEVHPKYQKQHAQSFLQKGMTSTSAPSNPGGPPRWQIVDQAHCGCGTLEDAGCPALLTLIGQELECAKQIVREQEAKINDQQEKDKAERDEINQAIKQLEAAIANYVKIVLASYNEMKSYREMVWQNLHTVWQFWYETETERFKCYLKLSELEANSFCAIKHIRSFMKGIALQALGLDEEDVQDCQYADFMRETGECFAMNGEVSKCIEGDVIPSDVELLPKATWTRDLIKPLKQSDKVEKAIGSNATIAMACPSTKALKMKCNTFLCPLDCEISEFSEWSKCTAECDTGFQQRTAQVVTMSRNGGNSCPETQESRECNTHSCDVDCVLHEAFEADPVGCLKACVNGPEPRNMLLRKHIKEEAIGKGTCPGKIFIKKAYQRN